MKEKTDSIKAKVSLLRNQDKEIVKIVLNDINSAKQFQDDLFNIGILSTSEKNKPRKFDIFTNESKLEEFIFFLSADEYNAIRDDSNAYAQLVSGLLEELVEFNFLSTTTHPSQNESDYQSFNSKGNNLMSETKIEIPEEFICPITHKIIFNPVSTSIGQVYEQEAITKWLQMKDTDPLTNEILQDKKLTPNFPLKSMISKFLGKYPRLWETEEVYFSTTLCEQIIESIQKNDTVNFTAYLSRDPRLLKRELKNGKDLLTLVCEQGSIDILRIILSKLDNSVLKFPCVINDDGAEIFEKIAKGFGVEGARFLNQALSWNKEKHQYFFEKAVQNDRVELISVCIALGVNPNLDITVIDQQNQENQQNPLFFAYSHGKYDMIKALIKGGADIQIINRQVDDLLLQSITEARFELAGFLLNQENSIHLNFNAKNHDKENALLLSIKKEQPRLIELLLNHPNVNIFQADDKGNTALHYAVAKRDKKLVEQLLEKGSSPYSKNKNEQTPLDLAFQEEDKALLESFIPFLSKAGIENYDEKGNNLFMRFICDGNIEMVNLLLNKFKLSSNSKSKTGETALILAVRLKRKDIVGCLLSCPDTDVNLPDAKGNTAMHHAVLEGDQEIAGLLLNYGASIKLLNEDKKTPLDIAQSSGHAQLGMWMKREYQRKKFEPFLQDLQRESEQNQTIKQLEEKIKEQDQRMKNQDKKIAEQSEQNTKLVKALELLNQKTHQIEELRNKVVEFSSQISTNLKEVNPMIQKMNERKKELLNPLYKKFDEQDNKIKLLQEKISRHEQPTGVNSEIYGQQIKIDTALQQFPKKIDEFSGVFQDKIKDQNDKIDRWHKKVDSIEQRLNRELEGKIEKFSDNFKNKEQEQFIKIDQLHEKFQSFENRLNRESKERIEKFLNDQVSRVNLFDKEINNLKQKLNDLEQKLDKELKEELPGQNNINISLVSPPPPRSGESEKLVSQPIVPFEEIVNVRDFFPSPLPCVNIDRSNPMPIKKELSPEEQERQQKSFIAALLEGNTNEANKLEAQGVRLNRVLEKIQNIKLEKRPKNANYPWLIDWYRNSKNAVWTKKYDIRCLELLSSREGYNVNKWKDDGNWEERSNKIMKVYNLSPKWEYSKVGVGQDVGMLLVISPTVHDLVLEEIQEKLENIKAIVETKIRTNVNQFTLKI